MWRLAAVRPRVTHALSSCALLRLSVPPSSTTRLTPSPHTRRGLRLLNTITAPEMAEVLPPAVDAAAVLLPPSVSPEDGLAEADGYASRQRLREFLATLPSDVTGRLFRYKAAKNRGSVLQDWIYKDLFDRLFLETQRDSTNRVTDLSLLASLEKEAATTKAAAMRPLGGETATVAGAATDVTRPPPVVDITIGDPLLAFSMLGLKPSDSLLPSRPEFYFGVLKALRGCRQPTLASTLHQMMNKAGVFINNRLGALLCGCYSQLPTPDVAASLSLLEMARQNARTTVDTHLTNAILSVVVAAGDAHKDTAIKIYEGMGRQGQRDKPNALTYDLMLTLRSRPSSIKASTDDDMSDWEGCLNILGDMINDKYIAETYQYNHALRCCAVNEKFQACLDLLKVMETLSCRRWMCSPDAESYLATVESCVKARRLDRAVETFRRMVDWIGVRGSHRHLVFVTDSIIDQCDKSENDDRGVGYRRYARDLRIERLVYSSFLSVVDNATKTLGDGDGAAMVSGAVRHALHTFSAAWEEGLSHVQGLSSASTARLESAVEMVVLRAAMAACVRDGRPLEGLEIWKVASSKGREVPVPMIGLLFDMVAQASEFAVGRDVGVTLVTRVTRHDAEKGLELAFDILNELKRHAVQGPGPTSRPKDLSPFAYHRLASAAAYLGRWEWVDEVMTTVNALQRGPDPELGRVVVEAAAVVGACDQGLAVINRLKRERAIFHPAFTVSASVLALRSGDVGLCLDVFSLFRGLNVFSRSRGNSLALEAQMDSVKALIHSLAVNGAWTDIATLLPEINRAAEERVKNDEIAGRC